MRIGYLQERTKPFLSFVIVVVCSGEGVRG
jgi:hypothetical protein